MWPHIENVRLVAKARALEAYLWAGLQPGDCVLREAPPAGLGLHALIEIPDIRSPFDDVASAADADSPADSPMNAALYICRLIYGRFLEKREAPTRSPLSKAIEAIVGSRRRFRPFDATADVDKVTSRWLARQYFFARLRDFVDDRLEIKKRLAATRERVLQYVGRPVAETGSSAAIAKRINPLGAPRKSHEGGIYGTCNERPE